MLTDKLAAEFAKLDFAQYLEDDAVLDGTRKVRLMILNSQLKDGIPNTTDEFEMLHKNLQELDKQALKKKQIAAESDSANVNAALIQQIAESVTQHAGTNNIHAIGGGTIPNVDHLLPTCEIIEGELEVGVIPMTYDNFMANEGKQIAEAAAKRFDEEGN